VYILYFIVCITATGAYLCVFCLFFVLFCVYMLAASVSYGWPALSTFGFSGNPALLLLVLNCRDGCLMFIYVKQISSSSSSFSFTQYNLIHSHLQLS